MPSAHESRTNHLHTTLHAPISVGVRARVPAKAHKVLSDGLPTPTPSAQTIVSDSPPATGPLHVLPLQPGNSSPRIQMDPTLPYFMPPPGYHLSVRYPEPPYMPAHGAHTQAPCPPLRHPPHPGPYTVYLSTPREDDPVGADPFPRRLTTLCPAHRTRLACRGPLHTCGANELLVS